VAKCKDKPADVNVKKDAIPDAKVDEEAERKWLSEMERVEANIFAGKKLHKGVRGNSNRDIAQEYFNKEDRRIGKNTTVMVDGFAISKESIGCAQWEAVPTLAGKDPRLAEPKRAKKAGFKAQSHCQVCIDGGELHCCQSCPRAYHYQCLDRDYQSKAKGWQFHCPQHQCFDCRQGTTDAGGMLYRCRWCERGYCEDCIEWEKTTLIGDSLTEYELLEYPAQSQAFYIQCSVCTDHFKEHPKDKKLCDDLAEGIQLEYEHQMQEIEKVEQASQLSTRAGSLTDATSIETPGISTPILVIDDDDTGDFAPGSVVGKKRKLKLEPKERSTKRERLSVY
jgi:SWI/SNF-related matrix-associated actin-dependent regulator of chromatin subfamily A member 5